MAVNINIPSQVKTYANLAAFPASGAVKTIYIAEDTNKTYRWTGTAYVEISGADFSGFVPTSRTLTINGVTQDLSADRTFTIATGLTVGTTPIASGNVGRVLFQGTGNVLQQSSQLSWDNSTNALTLTTGKVLSAYTSAASNDALKLEVSNLGAVFGVQNSNASGFSGIEYLSNAGVPRVFTGFNNGNGQEFRFNNVASGGYIDFLIGSTSGLRIANTRNILINTTTDAGFKLDVNGSARVQGLGTFGNAIRVIGQGIFGANGTNNAGVVGIDQNGTSSAARIYMCNAAGSAYPIWFDAGGNSYFNAGNVGIGTTTPLVSLDIRTSNNSAITPLSTVPNTATTLLVGNTGTNGALSLGQNNTGQSWIQGRSRLGDGSSFPILLNPLGGNILIGTTTDAGFRLDVNGTARFSDKIFFGRANFSSNDTDGQLRLVGNAVVYNSSGAASTSTTSTCFEITSTTKGFLPPRMTTTQRNAIASPAAGLIVYDTTLNLPHFFNGTIWVSL